MPEVERIACMPGKARDLYIEGGQVVFGIAGNGALARSEIQKRRWISISVVDSMSTRFRCVQSWCYSHTSSIAAHALPS